MQLAFCRRSLAFRTRCLPVAVRGVYLSPYAASTCRRTRCPPVAVRGVYLSPYAVSTCRRTRGLPVALCPVYLSPYAVSTCRRTRCLPVDVRGVYLSLYAVSTCRRTRCLPVALRPVYLSPYAVSTCRRRCHCVAILSRHPVLPAGVPCIIWASYLPSLMARYRYLMRRRALSACSSKRQGEPLWRRDEIELRRFQQRRRYCRF